MNEIDPSMFQNINDVVLFIGWLAIWGGIWFAADYIARRKA